MRGGRNTEKNNKMGKGLMFWESGRVAVSINTVNIECSVNVGCSVSIEGSVKVECCGNVEQC